MKEPMALDVLRQVEKQLIAGGKGNGAKVCRDAIAEVERMWKHLVDCGKDPIESDAHKAKPLIERLHSPHLPLLDLRTSALNEIEDLRSFLVEMKDEIETTMRDWE